MRGCIDASLCLADFVWGCVYRLTVLNTANRYTLQEEEKKRRAEEMAQKHGGESRPSALLSLHLALISCMARARSLQHAWFWELGLIK